MIRLSSSKRIIITLTIAAASATCICAQTHNTVAFTRPGATENYFAYYADLVDESPRFPGGDAAMQRFINKERQYPRDAYEAGIEGRVVLGFVVDVDGSITSINVHRGHNRLLVEEAVRIVSVMPKWKPGSLEGRQVPVYCVVTIPFRL